MKSVNGRKTSSPHLISDIEKWLKSSFTHEEDEWLGLQNIPFIFLQANSGNYLTVPPPGGNFSTFLKVYLKIVQSPVLQIPKHKRQWIYLKKNDKSKKSDWNYNDTMHEKNLSWQFLRLYHKFECSYFSLLSGRQCCKITYRSTGRYFDIIVQFYMSYWWSILAKGNERTACESQNLDSLTTSKLIFCMKCEMEVCCVMMSNGLSLFMVMHDKVIMVIYKMQT